MRVFAYSQRPRGFRYSAGAMSTTEPHDFSTACGMPNNQRVLDVEVLEQGQQIVCVCVYIVASPRLLDGPTVPALIVSNALVATVGEEEHLIFRIIEVNGQPCEKHHELTIFTTPVLIKLSTLSLVVTKGILYTEAENQALT